MRKGWGQRTFECFIILVGTGLAIIAILYFLEGHPREAAAYGISFLALAAAYAAWRRARKQLAREKEDHTRS